MILYHPLSTRHLELSSCICRHSGDLTVPYKYVDGSPLTLSIYFPPEHQTGKRYPLFVFVHGGGWTNRRIFPDQSHWAGDYLGFLARYYAEKGYICVSIDYRTLGSGKDASPYELIDLYEDCADAVTYLKTREAEFGLDFTHSIVLGESAGGHLAGALATFSYRDQPQFQKAILVNPITDLLDSRWMQFLPSESTHPVLQGKSKAEQALFLSPAHQIGSHTPETLLIHGTADTVVRPMHAQSFYDEMCRHNRKAQLHWIADTNHAFLLAEYMQESQLSLDAAAIAMEIIDAFLRQSSLAP